MRVCVRARGIDSASRPLCLVRQCLNRYCRRRGTVSTLTRSYAAQCRHQPAAESSPRLHPAHQETTPFSLNLLLLLQYYPEPVVVS
eukprot:COSAG06_NODE_508_length_14925_cov_18.648995_9_plen_86_part_00